MRSRLVAEKVLRAFALAAVVFAASWADVGAARQPPAAVAQPSGH